MTSPNKKRRPARSNVGKIPKINTSTTFEAGQGYVTAVITLDEKSTIGIRFESPEQMLEFCSGLMKHAVLAWPDNEYVKYYMEQ